MDQKRIEKLCDQYRKKADRNFRYYQETGEPRYERESRTAEEIADALSVALDHAEEEVRTPLDCRKARRLETAGFGVSELHETRVCDRNRGGV